ncbi:MAG: PAS domain-containing protein [bacterium]|nr:PAS domain-containing protein [bacterium]
MHLHVLVPLAACVGACAITSAILARDPTASRTRIAAAILASAAFWGLCDFLAAIFHDPTSALFPVRLSMVPVLAIPPLALRLFLEQSDDLRERYSPFLIPVWLCSVFLMPAGVLTPVVIANVVWTDGGWVTKVGPLYYLVYVPGAVCVTTAMFAFRSHYRVHLVSRPMEGEGRALAWVATLLLAVIPLTEVFTPLLGIGAPRLGALSVTVLGAALWFLSLNFGEYMTPPGAFSREMLDTLRDGVALITRDGRVRAANPAFAELARVQPGDLTDERIAVWLGTTLSDISDGGTQLETTLLQRDGATIPVFVSRTDLRHERGGTLGSVLVIRDLREVALLRRRLVTAGRLAAVGELAAGIVHEVNNPIAFIQSNLHYLQKNNAAVLEILDAQVGSGCVPEELRDVGHLVGQSLQDIARVASVVKEVRGFSHMGPTGVQTNDVNALLEDAVRIALPQLRARATLVREYGSLPLVECAGQDIRQVLLDLVLSAAHALEGSGTIRLCTSAGDEDVAIEVCDDGYGHTPAQVERIFDPAWGYDEGESSSDLCVAYQIVRQHGGTIRVDSAVGRGTTVKVTLPITPPGAVDHAQRSAPDPEPPDRVQP